MDKENMVVKHFQQFVPGEPQMMVAIYNRTQVSEDTVDDHIMWRESGHSHDKIIIITKKQFENIFE